MSWQDEDREWESELEGEIFDQDDDPEGDQLPCPSCGAMIYDDTDRCPHCGDWVMPLASAARGKSWVWIVAAILAVIALILWTIL